jgi:hypothetical protein
MRNTVIPEGCVPLLALGGPYGAFSRVFWDGGKRRSSLMWLASLSFFNERVNLEVYSDQLTPL